MTNTTTAPEAQAAAEVRQLTVATHDGVFHADECMAVAILRMAHAAPLAVIRTRNPELIAAASYVVDVGGEYDHDRQRYDHHQRGLDPRPNGAPYASAGLVWKHGWLEAVGSFDPLIDYNTAAEVRDAVDSTLMQPIDAADNGIRQEGYTISQFVTSFNPTWNEDVTPQIAADAFDASCDMMEALLYRVISHELSKIEAKQLVADAWDDSPRDEYPGVLVLKEYMPWQALVADMPGVQLVVYPSIGGGWKVQVVEEPGAERKPRCPLPSHWWGLEGDALDAATELPGGVFCHKNGFIAGHTEFDGAMSMASAAIANHQP